MLFTENARDTYADVKSRWAALDAWLADPANAAASAQVSAPIAVFRAHWQDIDDDFLSDSDAVCGAETDIHTAETTAMSVGYPKPAAHDVVRDESCTVTNAQQGVVEGGALAGGLAGGLGGGPAGALAGGLVGAGIGQTGVAVDTYCQSNPTATICKVTDPAPQPTWCRRLDLPDFICSDWFPWALGGAAVATLGVIGYAAFKAAEVAAPIAAAIYAPEVGALVRASRRSREGGLNAFRGDDLEQLAIDRDAWKQLRRECVESEGFDWDADNEALHMRAIASRDPRRRTIRG